MFVYAYDAALEKRWPAAVVLPRSAEEVQTAARVARQHGVPYAARGAGTNLCGGSVPAEGGLVIHLARMNRILSIDPVRRRVWVEPGVVNLHLQKALAPHGLFYAPDPASQKACTLGGNVGTNAGGPHCLKHGVTSTHVTGLEVVLPDGEFSQFSVNDPGFDLTGFWVGAEGTLGVATKIELNVMPKPEAVETFLAAFPSMDAAARTVTDTISAGIVPTTLEVMDRLTVQAVEDFLGAGYPRDAAAVLLIEIDGAPAALEAEGEKIHDLCRKNGATEFRRARDEREREKLWEGRRGSYPAMARLAPNVLVEDGVVPRTRLPEAVRRIRAIADREGLRMGLIAHAGDGNLHPNLIFDERNVDETRRVKAAGEEMLRVCVDLGGSISGEHGIGTDKREAMRWLFTPETLAFFRLLKNVLDPENLANPGKLLPVVEAPPLPPPTAPVGTRERVTETARLQSLMAWAQTEGQFLVLAGKGTSEPGPPPSGATVLDLTGLDQVVDHDRENFTLTVQAGAELTSLRRTLEEQGHYLYVVGSGTVGGAIAANPGGWSRVRDQILGLKAVLPGGALISLGGKVVKNVAGYDAAKLFIGSWGTLGAIVEITFRLHPRPAEEQVRGDRRRPDFTRLPTAALHRAIQSAVDPRGVLNHSRRLEAARE